jgi:DNA-binding Lrp family transcriptional regulator
MTLDLYDKHLLDALQRNGALTNTELSQKVNLSASQCSRRRAALEQAGYIDGYAARLNALQLGFRFRAIVRVNLQSHGKDTETTFARWVERQPEIQSAFSVSGDADYVLQVRTHDLDSFSEFMHEKLLIQPQVAQVRSDIILRSTKDSALLDVAGL